MGGLGKKCFLCHMVSLLVYSKLKQCVSLCASITMSSITACRLCQTSVTSKNSFALFSTTWIWHKLTGRIVHLLEVSGNKLVISRRYHTKTFVPLYEKSVADCLSGLGLSSGLSNCWRAYEGQQSGSSVSDDVCERKAVQYCYYIMRCQMSVDNLQKPWNSTTIEQVCKQLKTGPFSSFASIGLGMRLTYPYTIRLCAYIDHLLYMWLSLLCICNAAKFQLVNVSS